MPKDTHAAFVRALFFGLGAAVLGMVLYAAFTIITGFFIGYVSLAVGWLVGKAMMMGSKGIGGRRYQILAALLTYAAVSIAAVPIALHYQFKEKSAKTATEAAQQQPSTEDQTAANPSTTSEPEPEAKVSMGAALAQLLFLGLASPFLELQDPFHGIIGLVILAVGIRIAWKMTGGSSRADVQGPYDNSAAASTMR